MSWEPTWSQPTVDWQQHGSFVEPAAPPLNPPGAAPLVQLPCVNQDWLPLILGGLDQLRNPSSWLVALTDAQREEVLARTDDLRRMVAMAINNPCCQPAFRFTSDCHLQTSTDGGSNWTTVAGWDENIQACVRSWAPPPVPPNPQGLSTTDKACAIAEYLAHSVLQSAIQQLVTSANLNIALLNAVEPVISFLGLRGFVLVNLAYTALSDLYRLYVQTQIAHWQAAQGNATLFFEVQCAIYSAIAAAGYVTPSNFAAAGTNLAAISYTDADVVTGIADTWTKFGIATIQQLQVEAPLLASYDCNACGGWCKEWDFTLALGNWQLNCDRGAATETWVLNQGILGGYTATYNQTQMDPCLSLVTEIGHAITATGLNIWLGSNGNATGIGRNVLLNLGATNQRTLALPVGQIPELTPLRFTFPATTFDAIYVPCSSLGSNRDRLAYIQITGTGANPFPAINCVH